MGKKQGYYLLVKPPVYLHDPSEILAITGKEEKKTNLQISSNKSTTFNSLPLCFPLLAYSPPGMVKDSCPEHRGVVAVASK